MLWQQIHDDDTTAPVLARGIVVTSRLWFFVRDDRPFAEPAPPTATIDCSPDRTDQHPRQHVANDIGFSCAAASGRSSSLRLTAHRSRLTQCIGSMPISIPSVRPLGFPPISVLPSARSIISPLVTDLEI
jgi:hypothetical protein